MRPVDNFFCAFCGLARKVVQEYRIAAPVVESASVVMVKLFSGVLLS